MYKASVFLILAVIIGLASFAQADVLISELCDPRNNYLTDRYIEVYNSGPAAADLTGWTLTAMGNGSEIFTWNLSGSIAPGEALVCGALNTVDVFPVDFADDVWASSNATWNGKVGDGARLRNASSVIVDDIVVPGTTFENDTMERNEDITVPNLSFVLAEWTIYPINLPSEATPGTHHAPPPVEGPAIGAITTLPGAPLPGQTVDVEAVVTDTLATITSVALDWGTTSGSLTNNIAMTLTGDDIYATVTSIPGQPAGTNVYYQITASNDAPAATVSAELSYGIPVTVTVQDIQGLGADSPYVGSEVITSGIITADYGSSFVIQNGTGVRSGLWVEGAALALGSLVEVRGVVQEIDSNTTLTGGTITAFAFDSVPAATVVTTGDAGNEDWEGVLLQTVDAQCTISDPDTPRWEINNTGGPVYVDDLGLNPGLVLGTRYTVTGPMSGKLSAWGLVPRTVADIVFVADDVAPSVLDVGTSGPTTVLVTFSEQLDPATAETAGNYVVSGAGVTGAALVPGQPEKVTLTVTPLFNGNYFLTVNGVEDLYGNAVSGLVVPFSYYTGDIPPGYYDPAAGLVGEPLQSALHLIIDGHSSVSYDGLWTAFYSTDDKPNGKVWDMYSDVPGGTPPYEYTFGVDQGGSAGSEGSGYNREHSWPSSWYGATSPMYTDLFMVYPTDNEVNNRRGSFPFGEVTSPTWTSLNGCEVGACTYPGYTGTVFEPIDEYKGDFARAYFYMTTRYYGEGGSWPGSDMTTGSSLLPWAENMLLEWHADDPVSVKEVDRNEDVYAIQGNRNPFIDRPDFVLKVFKPELSPVIIPDFAGSIVLHQNVPNPFNPATTISYELESASQVDLQIFDLGGRLIRTLVRSEQSAGRHEKVWLGRDREGRTVATGVYFYRLRAGDEVETRRMLLAK